VNEAAHPHETSAVSYDEKVIPTLDKHKERDRFQDEVCKLRIHAVMCFT